MSFNLGSLVERIADAAGERAAVVAPGRTLSYRELDQRASLLAGALVGSGVRRGDRIAVAVANRAEHIETLLAAFKAGAVPVNLNRQYVGAELAQLFGEARPAAVIGDADLSELLGSVAGSVPVISVGEEYERFLASHGPLARPAQRSDDEEYLIFTAGSTGRPKGVRWTHRDLFFAALGGGNLSGPPIGAPEELSARMARRPARTLLASPLTHGTAQWAALTALLAAHTLLLTGAPGFDAVAVLDLAASERASHLVVVGDAFLLPLTDALDAEPDRWALDGLVVVASGGAPLSAAAADRLLAHLPGAVVSDGFGSSETGGQGRRILVPGQPLEGVRFTLAADAAVLSEDGVPLQAGAGGIGRVARSGPLPIGYADPSDALVTHTDETGKRWVLTNDLARVEADGSIVPLGRVEHLINSGGEKIHPPEVEAVIRSHPAVREAIVVGSPHPRFGEEVAAVVSLYGGSTLTLERLRRHCRPHLARFKLPRRLVVVDELPRTPVGKPDTSRAKVLVKADPQRKD